jgi:hypothetical protein
LARLQEPELVFQGLSSVFALGFLSFIPRSWSKLVFVEKLSKTRAPMAESGNFMQRGEKIELGPLSTLVFLVFYPIVQFFLQSAKVPSTAVAAKSCPAVVQRIGNLVPLIGDQKNHGTASLSIIF